MLELTVKQKEIEIIKLDVVLRGTVGAKCKVKFENFWNKYNKTIVFKRVSSGCGKPFKVIVNSMEETIEIPWEILVESGAFQIGAYGVTENEVLPTLWSEEIKIEYATDTNGETPKPYSLNEIEQLKLQKQNKLTAGANIVIEDDVISAIGGGGGSGIVVETTYNPESYNAQSGVALAPEFQKKFEFWQPNTEYKVGDYVVAIVLKDNSPLTVSMVCNQNHTSPDKETLDYYTDLDVWDNDYLYAYSANRAVKDANLNIIHETYVTNEALVLKGAELSDEILQAISADYHTAYYIDNNFTTRETFNATIGDIETALDNIIDIQDSLIGGGSV